MGNEKEIIQRATVNAMGKNKYGDLKQDELQNQLDKEAEGKTEATDVGEEFEILFKESNRYYIVDKDGNIGDSHEIVKDNFPGDLTKGGTLDGSEDKPYEINCIEDLVVLSNMSNGTGVKFQDGKAIDISQKDSFKGKKIVLKRNLNFKSKYSYTNSERTDFGNINGNDEDGNTLMNEMTTGTGFMPIGGITSFQGEFDGSGYKIEELYECDDNTNIKAGGIFGIIGNAKIENLQISGNIKRMVTTASSCQVGGICGMIDWNSKDNIINNCISSVKIEANAYGAAGIVGRTGGDTKIINCQNYGEISNNGESTGGIIGRIENINCDLYNNCNIGNIKGSKTGKGGILGENVVAYNQKEINIFNVYNLGQIYGSEIDGKGGIIGKIVGKTNINMQNVYNLAKIDGKSTAWNEGIRKYYRLLKV